MKDFKFNFLNGYYLVSVKDENGLGKNEDLQILLNVQKDLHLCMPHRSREIDSFILSCVNEVLNGVSPK